MGTLQFKNNASTTLSGSINDTQTSITVISSASFPVPAAGDYFYATMYEVSGAVEINIEIVKVTSVIGNVWTIVRAQDSSSARSRNGVATCYIENRMTAASAQLMTQRDNNLSDLSSAATARTNLGLGTMATQSAGAVNITGGTIAGVTIAGVDSTTTIADNADSTKKVAFEVSGVTTGTTRTLTIPNASGTIALTSDLTAGYQPLDSDLTALAALSANGIIARTAAGTMAVRSLAAPVSGFTITNSDGVSGNPTFALSNDLAAIEGIATTGFVRRTGVDTWSASAIVDADLPAALTGKTYNALTLTSNAAGFSVAGGTTSKTLTVSNSITLAGTDGTTITLPTTSGTVALNNQTMFIGTSSVAINRASASLSLTGVSIDGAAGSATTATTATKATNLAGGNNTTLLGSIGYQSNTDTTTLLSPNVTATKQFMAMTGTGTNGAAPVWSAVSKSDVGLSAVENTAVSTWAGSANITTLGTVATGTWNATTISIAKGGTGATTAVAAFDALSPATTLGDLIYSDGADNVRLAGNITATRRFLRQTGTGTVSAAPAWDTLTDPDIPSALSGKTYNSLTLTSASVGFTVAGGATSKTLTVSNTLTLAGTDASTLNIGAGGTLGSAAYTASTAYAPAAGSSSIVTVGTIASGTWTGSAIGLSYGGTGATSKTDGYNALSPMTTLGDLEYHDGTNGVRLAGNTAASKRFLTQTGTGTVSAAPSWNSLLDADLPSALTGKTYNGLTLTANTTGFAVAGGTTAKTLTISNNLTLTGTDGSTLNIGSGGTLGSAAYTASSAYLPTTSPVITTSATVPLLIGGTATTSTLTLRSTSGVGTTGADIVFQVGSNGATEALRILNSGNVGIGTTTPARPFTVATNSLLGTVYVTNNSGTTEFNTLSAGTIDFGARRELDNTTSASTLPNYRFSPNGVGTRGRMSIGLPISATIESWLHIAGPSGATAFDAMILEGYGNGGAGRGVSLLFRQPSATASTVNAARISVFDNAFTVQTGPAGALSERLRIDSAGNVGLGTVSPSTLLGTTGTITSNAPTGQAAGLVFAVNSVDVGFVGSSVAGTTIDARGATSISFQTNSSERVRIDSAGNMLVGTTTAGGKLTVNNTITFASQYTHGTTTGATTVAFTNGQNQKLTLTGNATLAFSFPGVGSYQLFLVSGAFTVTWPTIGAAWQWLNATAAPTLNTGTYGGVVNIYYDGTIAIASYSKVGAV